MRRIAALLLALPFAACADDLPRVASLSWLTGTWVAESERAKVTETWIGPGNGTMVAANLTTRGAGRKSFEFLRIAETDTGFSYYASPDGKPPTEFPLKEAKDSRVVFENPAHDFPRRILYWRDGEALVARVEGTVKGEARHEEWRFMRR